jgi:hypothetical protein
MGYTRQERTNQRQWTHGEHKTRKDTRDSRNMGYTRQERTPETVETWGTQDKKGQTRDNGNMGYIRHRTKKTMSNTITTKNGGTCEGYTVPVS